MFAELAVRCRPCPGLKGCRWPGIGALNPDWKPERVAEIPGAREGSCPPDSLELACDPFPESPTGVTGDWKRFELLKQELDQQEMAEGDWVAIDKLIPWGERCCGGLSSGK